ncbi:MAG: hypothetical protein HFJ72_06525 [Adlercreutzia sp.]|nr:hypothetical protein [Adlercreutzia sp.]
MPDVLPANYAYMQGGLVISLLQNPDPTNLFSVNLGIVDINSGTERYSNVVANRSANNNQAEVYHSKRFTPWNSSLDCVIRYESETDTLVMEDRANGQTISLDSARSKLGNKDSVYLYFSGSIQWTKSANPTVAEAVDGLTMEVTFRSMSLPHLKPVIEDIAIVDPDTNIPYEKNDAIDRGKIVRVECTVRNAHDQAASEQFPMHLKVANVASYPTQGIEAFIDAAHPSEVIAGASTTGTKVTSEGPDTVVGVNGMPVTLVGNTPVKVTYYARVNQLTGQAVKLSQALVEDSFGGAHYETADLLAEKPLKPAPDLDDPSTFDPDNPPVAGSDYHYTRLPAPNENGWNNTPVAVRFFGGDFDGLDIRGSDGSVLATLADGQEWERIEDVDRLPVSYKAHSSAGMVSTVQPDTLRIDTYAPVLSYDGSTEQITATDTPLTPANATSGIWKIQRVSDASLAEEDPLTERVADGETFTLTDGKGLATRVLSDLEDGWYVAVDAAGNQSAPVRVGEESGTDPAPDPSPDPEPDEPEPTPTPPTVTPVPDWPTDPDFPDEPQKPAVPIGPTVQKKDPVTGLTEALVEDTLKLGLSREPMGSQVVADYIADRYLITSALGDGEIARGKVHLFDAAGNEVQAIDRSKPGEWVAEQSFADSAGNTTTFRLRIIVAPGVVSGTLADDGSGKGSGTNGGHDSAQQGDGSDAKLARTSLSSEVLPATFDALRHCSMHLLLLVLALLVIAYGRQRGWSRAMATNEERGQAGRARGRNLGEAALLFLFAFGACAMGALGHCPLDWLLALPIAGLLLLYAYEAFAADKMECE